jgi:hypothetical protein
MIAPRWLAGYLHPGEKIIHLLYHSWIVMTGTVLGCLAMGILPLVIWYALPDVAEWMRQSPFVWLAAILVGSAFYLALLLFLLLRYTNYHLDFWIITSERLISVEQQSLFTQRIAEQELAVIQDITSEVKGIWATIMGFGDVQVRTASERPAIIIDGVNNPHGVRRELFKLIEQHHLLDLTPPTV